MIGCDYHIEDLTIESYDKLIAEMVRILAGRPLIKIEDVVVPNDKLDDHDDLDF